MLTMSKPAMTSGKSLCSFMASSTVLAITDAFTRLVSAQWATNDYFNVLIRTHLL